MTSLPLANGRHAGPLRVCVTGAECTGKTSLALALARRYAAPIVREFSRDYFTEKLARGDASVHPADLLKVMEEQARREDQAGMWTGPVMFCDTDVFTVAIWAERYLHERRPEIDRIADERRAEGKGGDLYLLCPPDFPFEIDGLRTGGVREQMHPVYVARLTEAGVRFAEVGGTQKQRLAAAVSEVERLLAQAP